MPETSGNGWFARRSKPKAAPLRVLTAAATRLSLDDKKEARRTRALRQGWQSDAWAYRDSIGELRYAVSFLANCASRMRLYVAAYPAAGESDNPVALRELTGVPEQVTSLAAQAMSDLGNGKLAVSGLLHTLSTNQTVAGECYLLGRQDEKTGQETWTIRSIDEIIIADDEYKLREMPQATGAANPQGYISLDPARTVVSRIWAPHPRFQILADSPLRAIMDDCESLMILRRMIRATGRSRLAGRGLLLVPDELSIKVPIDDNADPESDPIMAALAEAMMTPIADEGDARAVVPIVIRGPGETLDKVKHIDFASSFDEMSSKTREELVGIIATGLDIPKEIISGISDLNHWSAWQVDDNTFRHHVEPHVIGCCDALTSAYLRPYLEAAGVERSWAERCVIWYDPTELVTHPDQTADAILLHDRLVISDEALMKTSGFSEEDAPSKQEIQVRLLMAMRQWPPNLVMAFLAQWDPTLRVPPIETSGAIPGIAGGVVDPGTGSGEGDIAPAPIPEPPHASPAPSVATPGTDLPGPPPVTAAASDEPNTGSMVAFYLQSPLATTVALAGGEAPEDLHITLAFLGDAAGIEDPEALQTVVAGWAVQTPEITGEISGVGLFTAGPDPVTYLSVDTPALPDARQSLIDALVNAGMPVSFEHGYTPHCTLAYDDRTAEVNAGGTPIAFDSVAVILGEERTDYPLIGDPPAVVAAAKRQKDMRLSRKLTEIDRDLRTRLQTAANAAMLRQLERAGARLRTKVAKDETSRTAIARRPNERVAAILGEGVVTAAGLSAKELMGGDWSALKTQFMDWTEAAQKQAVANACRIAHLDSTEDAVVAADAAMASGREAAWGVLQNSLTNLGHTLLYNPSPNATGDWGDLNLDTLVPTGMLRAVLAVAGGDSPLRVGVDEVGLLDVGLREPIGQIGTGATIEKLVTGGGAGREGYEWVHGPSLNPFEPHEALDGVEFLSFDDEALANPDSFPDNEYFIPGDHDGCTCDFMPLWLSPGDGG